MQMNDSPSLKDVTVDIYDAIIDTCTSVQDLNRLYVENHARIKEMDKEIYESVIALFSVRKTVLKILIKGEYDG